MKDLNGKNLNSGGNNLISELEEKIERYARVPHYVLITGERGTGKTTIARRLHEKSTRAKREFVNLNCASLTQELLESELFGYEKGAFTGATAPKAGLFKSRAAERFFSTRLVKYRWDFRQNFSKRLKKKASAASGAMPNAPLIRELWRRLRKIWSRWSRTGVLEPIFMTASIS